MSKRELYINFLKSMSGFSDGENLKWVIYVRKSSQWDAKQPNSIENQLREIKRYAERKNIELVKLTDELKSEFYDAKYLNNLSDEIKNFVLEYFVVIEKKSSRTNRERLDKLIRMINKDKIKWINYILVYHTDRVLKNLYVWQEEKVILSELLYKSVTVLPVYGGRIHLFQQDLTEFGEVKGSYVKDETRSDDQYITMINMLRNKNYNNLSYLYWVIVDNKGIYMDERNFYLVKTIFEKAKENASRKDIIDYLEKNWFNHKKIWAKDIKNFKLGKTQTKYSVIKKILENPIYMWEYVDKKFNHVFLFTDIDFPLVVDMETFYSVNKIDLKEILFWDLSSIFDDFNTDKANICLYNKNNRRLKLMFKNSFVTEKFNKNIFNKNIDIIRHLIFKNATDKEILKWDIVLELLYKFINKFVVNLDMDEIKWKIINYSRLLAYYNYQLDLIKETISLLEEQLKNSWKFSAITKKTYENNLYILRKNEKFVQNIISEYSINIYDLKEIIEVLNYKQFKYDWFDQANLLKVVNTISYSIEKALYDKKNKSLWLKYYYFPSIVSL